MIEHFFVGPDALIGPLDGSFRRGLRRLRAATYFAHGGSSSQSPLDSVSAWWRKLRSFPCSSSSRRTHFVGLRREVRERLPKTPPETRPKDYGSAMLRLGP